MAREIASFAAVTGLYLGVFTSGCSITIEPPADPPPATSASSSSTSGAGGGGGVDAGGGGASSRCTATSEQVWCPYETLSLPGKLGAMRDVIWQVPLGAPPAEGWRVAFLFQGSFYAPALMFDASDHSPHGGYYVASTVKGPLEVVTWFNTHP